ncbi:MAG: pyridoxamine 5'-phosphate oxidase [Verrucomicrobia bacterium]|nr:pyridoxamine 5'-phosphate oxidase [Verrucomicrobiota bacterium]
MQTDQQNAGSSESSNVAAMRVEYSQKGLRREDLAPDPVTQFTCWFQEACAAGLTEPNAVVLATVSATGQPSTRTVLIKNYDKRGFVFFTNFESRKARQMGENPNVSILFPWIALERQVIIEGKAEKISTAESIQYFLRRPHGSQIAATVSRQSRVIMSRKLLEMEYETMKRKLMNGKVPFPSGWGGFRIIPAEFEFWQGRANRLHDRFRYIAGDENTWKIERLAP